MGSRLTAVRYLLVMVLLLQGGCGAHVYDVVEEGDTLYSISFRHGLDYRDVASWNSLGPPYTIREGQSIRVSRPPPGGETRAASAARQQTQTARPAVQPQSTTSRPPPAAGPPAWSWPVNGVRKRSDLSVTPVRKGLDIASRRGEPVLAAADGRVVYGGSGIPHYGNLLIIKHSEQFLSAYAHNDRLLVSEGQQVAAGQEIAVMGDSGTGTEVVKLHFEIRLDGSPVDPTEYLPK